jgi:hypothetical protein
MGRLRRRQRGIDRRAERAVAVAIRRRQLQQCDVQRQLPRQKHRWNVGQEDRHEVGRAFRDGRADKGADEHRDGEKAIAMRRVDKRRGSRRVQVIERHIAEVPAPDKCLEQRRRRRGPRARTRAFRSE